MKHKLIMLMVVALLAFGWTSVLAATQPVEVKADTIEYDSVNKVITAQGNVTMTQQNTVMTGRQAVYNSTTKQSIIIGDVRIVQNETTLTADKVQSNDQNHFIATGQHVVLLKGQDRLTGSQIDYYTNRNYALASGPARLEMPEAVMTAAQVEAFFDTNQAIASGSVHIISDSRSLDAVADKATYFGGSKQPAKLVLNGNVRAEQNGSILTGNTLTIFLDDKALDAQGRARLVVKPE